MGPSANDPTNPDLESGIGPTEPEERIFGARYRAVRVLKKGHGIETILANDLVQGDRVVIKTALRESLSTGVQMRLEHEAGVLSQIRSPWVAPLLHLGREQGLLYLVMPYVPGLTLAQR